MWQRVGLLLVLIGLWTGMACPAMGQDDGPLTCQVVELARHPARGFEDIAVVNGDLLLYRQAVPGFPRIELMRLPLDDPAGLTRVNVEGDVEIHGFTVSPRGDSVVFWQREPDRETYNLYYVPLPDIAPPVKLPLPTMPDQASPTPGHTRYTPDGTRVVVRIGFTPARTETIAVIDLATRDITTLVSGLDTYTSYSYVQVTDTHVVYTGEYVGLGFESRSLYSVPLDGSSPPVRLDERSGINGMAPDRVTVVGDRAVFMALVDDSPTGGRLFSVPLDGSTMPVRIIEAPPVAFKEPQFVLYIPFYAGADGEYLYTIATTDAPHTYRAVRVNVYTGAAETLSHTLPPRDDLEPPPGEEPPLWPLRGVVKLFLPPEAAHLFYLSIDADDVMRTYRVPLAGGDPVALPGTIPLNDGAVDPRGEYVLIDGSNGADNHTLRLVSLEHGHVTVLADHALGTRILTYGFVSPRAIIFALYQPEAQENILYLATCE